MCVTVCNKQFYYGALHAYKCDYLTLADMVAFSLNSCIILQVFEMISSFQVFYILTYV